MPRLEYFVVCRAASIDVETDEVTLSNIIEDVCLDDFPSFFPWVTAVSSWHLSPGEEETDFQAVVRIHVPAAGRGVPFAMNFTKNRLRLRAMQTVTTVPYGDGPDVRFELLLNGEHCANHVITVHPQGTSMTDRFVGTPRPNVGPG